MDRNKAHARWKALCNMTVARGCTVHEAEVAARLAKALAAKFGFADAPAADHWRGDFDSRYERAEARAAMHFKWEYRSCGKARCHCMKFGTKHGPYKYGKVRRGKHVASVYLGR